MWLFHECVCSTSEIDPHYNQIQPVLVRDESRLHSAYPTEFSSLDSESGYPALPAYNRKGYSLDLQKKIEVIMIEGRSVNITR